MHELVLNPTHVSQWHALIEEAQQSVDCKLDEDLESYLVFLLIRFTTKPEIANRILAMDYLESLQQEGKQRLNNLKDVGDHCLIYSGLFPQRATRRRVKISYFVDLGRSAYREVSEHANNSIDLFQELAHSFVSLMDVLQSIRSLGNEQPCLEPLQAYDLWQETGSKHAYQTLMKSSSGLPSSLIDMENNHKH